MATRKQEEMRTSNVIHAGLAKAICPSRRTTPKANAIANKLVRATMIVEVKVGDFRIQAIEVDGHPVVEISSSMDNLRGCGLVDSVLEYLRFRGYRSVTVHMGGSA